MKKTIGYVLSHTHWDREWYLSFQLFRMRLVDMLDTLISSTNIIGYKLKSTVYHIESIKIPSFIGYLTIRISGTAQTAQIAKLLLKYSEYSGVGIKTALGMGQTRIEEVIKR